MVQKTPILIFYHCAFEFGNPPKISPSAISIVFEQMREIRESGLLDACEEMIVGCNGSEKVIGILRSLIPSKARIVFHGEKSKSENLTLVELAKVCQERKYVHYYILYTHSKGVSHTPGTEYHHVASIWRRTMMKDLVSNWKQCVNDLRNGYDVACSCWEWGMADGTQNIAPGNFWWSKADFIAKLPSIFERSRIKMSGIASVESRFEAEVWLGNGPKPQVKQYREHWRPWQLLHNFDAT